MSDKPPSIPSPQEQEAARRRHRIAQKERLRQITRLNVARKLLYAMAWAQPPNSFIQTSPERLVQHAFRVADLWLYESHFLEIWEKDHEEAEEAERNGTAPLSLEDILRFRHPRDKKEN